MKKTFCLFLGILGILIFILQIFVFESPDGLIGYFVCVFSILLSILSFIHLYKISKKFQIFIKCLLEML